MHPEKQAGSLEEASFPGNDRFDWPEIVSSAAERLDWALGTL